MSKKEDGRHVVSIKLPSLGRLFNDDTNIQINYGRYGPFCYLNDEGEVKQALQWEEKHKQFIFLRDHLDFSMALAYNFESACVYTDLGRAERDAKIAQDKSSIDRLAVACLRAIADVTFYADSDVVCSVPPSADKVWDLPTKLVKIVSERSGKPNISNALRFNAIKQSVKTVSLQEKWAALEAGELSLNERHIRVKKIIRQHNL